jgi:hypothetical protein
MIGQTDPGTPIPPNQTSLKAFARSFSYTCLRMIMLAYAIRKPV